MTLLTFIAQSAGFAYTGNHTSLSDILDWTEVKQLVEFDSDLVVRNFEYVDKQYEQEIDNEILKSLIESCEKGLFEIKRPKNFNMTQLKTLWDQFNKHYPHSGYFEQISMNSDIIYLTNKNNHPNILEEIQNANKIADGLIYEIDKKTPEIDQIHAVFEIVIDAAKYPKALDISTYQKDNELHTPYGLLTQKYAVCEGYAKTIQLLLEKLEIPCIYVAGSYNGTSHGWNMVYLKGNWYHVDATWSDIDEDFRYGGFENSKHIIDNIRKMKSIHKFFMLSDAQLSETHQWDKDKYYKANDLGLNKELGNKFTEFYVRKTKVMAPEIDGSFEEIKKVVKTHFVDKNKDFLFSTIDNQFLSDETVILNAAIAALKELGFNKASTLSYSKAKTKDIAVYVINLKEK